MKAHQFAIAAITSAVAGTTAGAMIGGAAQAQTAPLAASVTTSQAFVKGPAAPGGSVRTITPDSSLEKPSDIGKSSHTHYRLIVPTGSEVFATPQATQPFAGSPPFSGYYFQTPASLACIYGLVAKTAGCDPNKVTKVATTGAKAIGIVDAFDNPTALADLQQYSTQFGLPAPKLQVVYASGSQPGFDQGWAVESALDIQMAHAMAPKAKIILVEGATNSNADLYLAIDKAYALVKAAGGGEISMSFGASESSAITSLETHFKKAGVVFFASTGDAAGVNYPSTSPNVVAVGGTGTSTEQLKAATFGQFLEETAWSETGGGPSAVFARPAYQTGVTNRFGTTRTVPDLAAEASGTTGVWIRFQGQWGVVGGTSVASPIVAGLTNSAGSFRASTTAELTQIYAKIGTASFFDVGRGVCGPYLGYFTSTATAGDKTLAYDLCTGVGAPRGGSGL